MSLTEPRAPIHLVRSMMARSQQPHTRTNQGNKNPIEEKILLKTIQILGMEKTFFNGLLDQENQVQMIRTIHRVGPKNRLEHSS